MLGQDSPPIHCATLILQSDVTQSEILTATLKKTYINRTLTYKSTSISADGVSNNARQKEYADDAQRFPTEVSTSLNNTRS